MPIDRYTVGLALKGKGQLSKLLQLRENLKAGLS